MSGRDDEDTAEVWDNDDGDVTYTDWYDDEWEEWENAPCSPMRCGECWGGDGICMREIEAQQAQDEAFQQRHVLVDTPCPGCQVALTRYDIPTTELWVWPGTWPGEEYYSPMIALNIFGVYDMPKGEVHEPVDGRAHTFHHIWVGTGEHRSEALIMLDKSKRHESS